MLRRLFPLRGNTLKYFARAVALSLPSVTRLVPEGEVVREELQEWSLSVTLWDVITQANANYGPQQHSAAALYSSLSPAYWNCMLFVFC